MQLFLLSNNTTLTQQEAAEPLEALKGLRQTMAEGLRAWVVIPQGGERLPSLLDLLPLDYETREDCLSEPPGFRFVADPQVLYFRFPARSHWELKRAPYVTLLLAEGLMVTILPKPIPEIERFLQEGLAGKLNLATADLVCLMYALIDRFSQLNLTMGQQARQEIDALAQAFDTGEGSVGASEIMQLRRKVSTLGVNNEDFLYLSNSLLTTQLPRLIPAEWDGQWKAMVTEHRHNERFFDRMETRAKELYDLLNLRQQEKANVRLQYLSILSAVFLPLSLMAGVYGMNFAWMPELQWRYGYPVLLLAMLAVAGGLLTFFWRRGWFD